MGYEIVYDRRFIRCGDLYIPYCLYGSSNVTERSYSGREVRERHWDLFSYGDSMVLATEGDLMDIVRKYHTGARSENFVFHGKWLDDAQVVKFFQNGIRDAVTIEEIRQQTRMTPRCFVSAYVYNDDADLYPESDRLIHTHYEEFESVYIKTSDELSAWVKDALAKKKELITAGKAQYAFLRISFLTKEPLRVCPRQNISVPCVAKGRYGYVKSATHNSWSYTKDIKEARRFQNSEEAYAYVSVNADLGAIKLVPWVEKTERVDNFILSVNSTHGRLYVSKLTARSLHYAYMRASAKRFPSEKAAMKWYAEKVAGRFNGVSDPIVEEIKNV